MIIFAVFPTEAQAFTRLQLENQRITSERGKDTIYSNLVNHPTDGTSIFNVGEDFDQNGVDIKSYEECINLGYFPDLTDPFQIELEEAKLEASILLIGNVNRRQDMHLTSTGVSILNSLIDLSVVMAKLNNDGTLISQIGLACMNWLIGLWTVWEQRREEINNAQTLEEIEAVDYDFMSYPDMPFYVTDIKDAQLALLQNIIGGIDNVPPAVVQALSGD